MIVNKQDDSQFFLPGPLGLIETRLMQPDEQGALADKHLVVVICHPHPVHGGTMDNKVVTTLERTYRDLGVTTVCFNFRGVGKSEGIFDNAVGEVDDLLAVIAWVNDQYPASGLLLAGFSFGSSIAAQACYRVSNVSHLLLVAPPVEWYSYDQEGHFPCAVIVVQGDRDERVNSAGVHNWIAGLKSPVELLWYEEASHFFHGYLARLKQDLSPLIFRDLR